MTVAQLDAPCWVITECRYERPHFLTREEALAVVGEYGPFARIEREDELCWLAKCSVCGESLGQGDDFDEIHYRTRAEAEGQEEAQDDHREHPDGCQCAGCLFEQADLPTGP
jgi:hypothetical protein